MHKSYYLFALIGIHKFIKVTVKLNQIREMETG